jgi:hypothetical protein
MMVDLTRLPYSLLQRYLGQPEARAFLEAQRRSQVCVA